MGCGLSEAAYKGRGVSLSVAMTRPKRHRRGNGIEGGRLLPMVFGSLSMPERPSHDYQAVQATRRAEILARLEPVLGGRTLLTLEIGCGHGHFLNAYATAHPDRHCLGIDIMSDRVRRGLRKRDRASLTNLAFLHADAWDLLAVLPAQVRLEAVFVLFPDPWPKRRHWKNRILQPAFLTALAEKSTPASPLYFRTDYEPYFAEAREVVASHEAWELRPDLPWPFEHTTVFQARAPTYHSLIAIRR